MTTGLDSTLVSRRTLGAIVAIVLAALVFVLPEAAGAAVTCEEACTTTGLGRVKIKGGSKKAKPIEIGSGAVPLEAGRPLATPKPVFRKLDPSIVDEELARLAG